MTVPTQSDRSPGWGLPREHGRVHRRALTVGIGASAAFHVVVIVLYSVGMTQWGPPETVLGVDSPSRSSSDMRVVRVVEIELRDLTAEPPRGASRGRGSPFGVYRCWPARSGPCRAQ